MARGTELPGGYERAAFTGRPGSIEAFLDAVSRRMPAKPALRLLDLGSGTGDVALGLAERLAGAEVVGLDISTANAALAAERAGRKGLGERVRFVAADYRQWSAPPFDVIVSDSVLHLIPADDRTLAAKLAGDLVPGGLLIATLPDECRRNQALLLQRRLWRITPPAFDRLALFLARRIYAGEPAAVLADRIGYLRVLPERVHGLPWSSVMGSAGLDEVEARPWPGASLFKLRHRLVVWRRRPG